MTHDEWIVDSAQVQGFIAQVQKAVAELATPDALAALRPSFAELLADPNWLPTAYQQPAPQSGMGSGIATWLIYRAGDGSLSLSALVVPAGASTPVHDHLAWGLVGLYKGEQDEQVFEHAHNEEAVGEAPLQLTQRNHLQPGDFYALLPPDGDIHSVTTTSLEPSISIHLLGNDVGCIWRHQYTPENGSVRAFRSGWTNVACRA